MRVYLVRHAAAVEAPPGARFLDDLRALTPRGRKRFKRTALAFAEMGEEIELVVSSPSVRTVQTAALLASQLERTRVVLLKDLRAGGSAIAVRDWLLEQRHASVALVGHGRQFRQLARLLLGYDPPFPLKKGSINRIDILGERARPRWSMRDPEQALTG
jgi:phosphohistidine phosphatase